MKRNLTFVLHAIGGIALLAAAVGAAMWLWNTLIPDIFGWKPVGYWQMLGLLALAHLFFARTAGEGLCSCGETGPEAGFCADHR